MLRDRRTTSCSVVLVMAMVAACTSDGGGTPTERVTSLLASRTWDSLSASERDQVCDEVQDYYDGAFADEELDRLECARAAIDVGKIDFSFTQDAASAAETCAMTFEECLADPQGSQTSPLDADCDFDKYTDCTFYIAEYEVCIVTTVDAASEDIAAFACDQVDWSEPADVVGAGRTDECQRLFDKCP